MKRISISETELNRAADLIGLPLDDATRETVLATVEMWLTDANDLREEMEQPEYHDLFPLCAAWMDEEW